MQTSFRQSEIVFRLGHVAKRAVAAIGINFVDIYFRTALYPPPSWPFTAGGEAAGTVTKVGKGVSGFQVGDRVAYVSAFGAYAEAANVPEKALVKLPNSISFEWRPG